MGAQFSRVKTWIKEKLTFADLNAEFDQIYNNFTPTGMDDLSTNTAAMQGVQDPYPAGSPSLPTTLAGELQRLRYVIAQITGETYWYIDPDVTLAAINTTLQSISEWMVQTAAPTYISGASFSVATDLTAVYTAGRRIKATVTAGTVYGTIVSSAFTTVTTITVLLDAGALDAGLSAVSLGIITPGLATVPRVPTVEKTDDYVITIADFGKVLIANKATAIGFTLPAANAVPVGWYINIFNSAAGGVLTLTGTINGVANPTLNPTEHCLLCGDGTAWHGLKSSSHTQVHAVTSTLDHTAGNWKVLHSNGSGELIELALGAAGIPLISNGATAAPTFGQIKSAGIESAAITGDKLLPVVANIFATGEYIGSAPTSRTSDSTSWVKLKEIIVKRNGTCLVAWSTAGSAPASKTCVRVNGSAVGTEKTGDGDQIDGPISFNYGDAIQIYGKTTQTYYNVVASNMVLYAHPWANYTGFTETSGY